MHHFLLLCLCTPFEAAFAPMGHPPKSAFAPMRHPSKSSATYGESRIRMQTDDYRSYSTPSPGALLRKLATPAAVFSTIESTVYAADRERDALLSRLKHSVLGGGDPARLSSKRYRCEPGESCSVWPPGPTRNIWLLTQPSRQRCVLSVLRPSNAGTLLFGNTGAS